MSVYLLSPLVLAGFGLVLLVIVVAFARPLKPVHIVFSAYLLAMAAYGAFIFLMRSSPDLATAYEWELRIVGFSGLLSAFLCHFCLLVAGTRVNRAAIILVYALAAALFVPQGHPYVISAMEMRSYGYAPVFGPFAPIWLAFEFGVLVWALVMLARRRLTAVSPDQRNRLSYIVAGLALAVIGGMFDILPVLGLPVLPGLIVGFILFCVLTVFAIVRDHLLDIRIVIRRGTSYLIVSAIVGIPYAAAVIAVNELVNEGPGQTVLQVVAVLAAALALQPAWRWAQNTVDRLFLRGRYDFLVRLQDLTRKPYSVQDVPTLVESVARLLAGAVRSSDCHVLVRTPAGYTDPVPAPAPGKPLALSPDHPLAAILESSPGLLRRRELELKPQLQAMTGAQAREVEALRADLYAPIKSAEGKLVAILTVGPRAGGRTYDLDEERTLVQTAAQLAVNLENAYLYGVEKSLRERVERETENRTEFLFQAAHEMRTPLTSIMAASELLSAEFPPDPADPHAELVDNIRASADNLNRRTVELLDFARIRTSGLVLKRDPTDLGALVARVCRQYELVLRQKGQSSRIEAAPGLHQVIADPARIEQVLLNILSNASKFSPADSVIRVAFAERLGSVVVSVADHAIPLTEEERGKLFQPYYLGDNPERHATGLGLGLAISRYIVELHGGRIWVESGDDGNIFSFSLPIPDERPEPGS